MKQLSRLLPYLPLALRGLTTALAFLGVVATAKEPFSALTLATAAGVAGAAWKRWHLPASLSVLTDGDPAEATTPATETQP